MRHILFIFVFLGFILTSNSQNLTLNRSTDWSKAGITNSNTDTKGNIQIFNYVGFPNGDFSNDSILSLILNTHQADDSLIIFFPNGEYLFNNPISLKSNITIKGESSDLCIFKFDLTEEKHCIQAIGLPSDAPTLLSQSVFANQQILKVNDGSLFSPQDYIYLIDNDSNLITSSWAYGTTGQIIRILDVNGDSLFLASPIRRNFLTTKGAKVMKMNPIENVGIESIKLQRLDQTQAQTSNIYFHNSVNSYVKCIQSIKCNYSHIRISMSSNNTVCGNYFKDAFSYGSGGKGYGVMLCNGSGECLVTENNFQHLRHSMILQAGANGNVISYNYSIQPYWTGVALPSSSAGDLVLHGNYPYLNLFEGNVVQNIVIDDSHGKNGHFNTFFRNRAEYYGIVMNNGTPSDSQNFIGNEVTNTGVLKGNYYLSGTGHFQYGNNIKGVVTPALTDQLDDKSMYLFDMPLYYEFNSNWPPIGLPNSLSAYTNETQLRATSNKKTKCADDIDLGIVESPVEEMKIYPNPSKGYLHIEIKNNSGDNEPKQIEIYNAQGSLVHACKQMDIDIQHLNKGVYFVSYTTENNSWKKQFVKL